ncbi:VOC family protein [Nakamurella leprariae]|uniref:VOC family protein n=1 Tax=Nakamurella leprariae TaxID=2803911 RepID=A0A938YHN0_9ACTN|nr:VOC family protein [Nakamurella leprariae]MBM9468003.1 VOC family protein [Nakamurella leprariae]
MTDASTPSAATPTPPTPPKTYPHGVTSWIDVEQPDPGAGQRFYGQLFGWQFTEAVPPGAPGSYLIATLDGQDVAAMASAQDGAARWNTYFAVDDADATAAAVIAQGGTVTSPPQDAGPGGRSVGCLDPGGISFRLWQARRRLGAQLVNSPGSWNFSDLVTADPDAVLPFYRAVFGIVTADMGTGAGAMLQVPGYGDHLASTSDPGIHERQAGAPAGFADVIGGIRAPEGDESSDWHVVFSVADRDAAVATAERLGATVLGAQDGVWASWARLRDPQGATFSVSQFTPPEDFG